MPISLFHIVAEHLRAYMFFDASHLSKITLYEVQRLLYGVQRHRNPEIKSTMKHTKTHLSAFHRSEQVMAVLNIELRRYAGNDTGSR